MSEEAVTPTESEGKGYAALAAEKFGQNYHGEAEPANEGILGEAPEEPEEVAETEETEEVSEEPEDTVEAEETEAEDEEEGETIESLSELAEYMREEHGLELDDEWMESLKVPAKVNGKEVQFSLKDLRDTAQKYEAADDYLNTAKEKAKAQLQEVSQKAERLNEYYSVAAQLLQEQENALEAESKSVDWKSLREDDPAEYAAKKHEFEERRQALEGKKSEAAQSYQKWIEDQQKEQQAALQEMRDRETQALMEKLPEWKDPEKSKAEKSRIVNYLAKEGFSQDEISNALDHRLIVMARKAMKYDEGSQSKETAKKKLKKIPQKSIKPGSTKSRDQVSREELESHKKRLKQSGDIKDAFALLQARKKRG